MKITDKIVEKHGLNPEEFTNIKKLLKREPNFLEIGIFHGVTARNVCNLLYSIHGEDFKFTGIDPFLNDAKVNDRMPELFSNPLAAIPDTEIPRTRYPASDQS